MANATTPVIQINEGKVGIGTIEPNSKLHVFGGSADVELKVTTNDNFISRLGLYEEKPGNLHGGFIQYRGESGDRLEIGSRNSGTDTVHMSIDDNSGNVGIGSLDPTGKLTIETAAIPGIRIYRAATNANFGAIEFRNSNDTATNSRLGFGTNYMRIEGTNNLQFVTNSTEVMRILTTGSIKFNAYNSTYNTGTPTYLLGTDATGNVVKTDMNIGERAYTLPSISGSSSWQLLGRFTAGNGGKSIFIKMVTNAGYNSSVNQNTEVYIRFKTSNGSSLDANGFSGDSSFYTIGAYTGYPGGNIKWVSNAAGGSASSYELYVNMPSYSGTGGFYTVEQTAGTWTPLNNAATDPGAASSTVMLPVKQFKIGGNDLVVGAGGSNSYFANGNVGIGEDSPDAKLHVKQTGAGANTSIITEDNARKLFIGRDEIKCTNLSNAGTILYVQHNSSSTSFGGNVTLGATLSRSCTYDAGGGNFRITPNSGGYSTGYFFNQSDGTFRGGYGTFGGSNTLSYFWIGDNYNDASMVIYPTDGSSSAGFVGIGDPTPGYKLDVNGTIRATGDVIAFSDARVKDNVVTIDNALDKVNRLRGVTYTRNDIEDKQTKMGVIAQEVLEVIPEVVQQDIEGNYSVAYGNMNGLLIEAIKELKAEIEELKSRL